MEATALMPLRSAAIAILFIVTASPILHRSAASGASQLARDSALRLVDDAGVSEAEKFAGQLNTIVIAKLSGGDGLFCDSDDWQGQLPRYIAEHNKDTTILIWENARHSYDAPLCHFCTDEGSSSEIVFCDRWMAENERQADALLVIGRGFPSNEATLGPSSHPDYLLRKFPELHNVASKPWITSRTWTALIPISMEKELKANALGFHRVVEDSAFCKPQMPEISAAMQQCVYRPRENVIVYVGRFSLIDHKGQRMFLEAMDAAELAGYTVHFFGGCRDKDKMKTVRQKIETLAADRGIAVEVHGEVEHHVLLDYLCRARGMVLFPRIDMNPRAAYESPPAGTPVYVDNEAGMPEEFLDLPFVYSDPQRGYAGDYPGFQAFMSAVRNSERRPVLHQEISMMANHLLSPERVYRQLCIDLGLCAPRAELPHWTHFG